MLEAVAAPLSANDGGEERVLQRHFHKRFVVRWWLYLVARPCWTGPIAGVVFRRPTSRSLGQILQQATGSK
jgi:hypothetical protein